MPRIQYSPPSGILHYARMVKAVLPEELLNKDGVADNMYLSPVQIVFTVTLDTLGWCNGGILNGNLRWGIYYDNGDLPDGGALIVEGGPALQAGANQKQEGAIVNTQLAPALYWFALACDDAPRILGYLASAGDGGTLNARSCAHPFGALPNPCPATAASNHWFMYGLVTSIP